MDPFTEKLLARTQARKTALAKKKEEVAGRSPAVTPRCPLLENNSNAPRSTLTENNRKDTPVKGTMGTPVVVTSTQFAGGTPKSVFFEKYAKQASLKQKECFIELEGVKEALKSTPKKEKSNAGNKESQLAKSTEEGKSIQNSHDPIENVIKASLDANAESPSVKDRRAMYMKQVQVVSTTPSKTSFSAAVKLEKESKDLVVPATSISDRLFPSVKEARGSLSGGRFFNDPRSEHTSSKTSEKISCLVAPAKPPRITVASKTNKEEKPMEAKNTNDVVPPKPTRSHSQSVAPVPPSKPFRNQVSECLGEDLQNKKLNGTGNAKRQAPAPPENDSCNDPQKDTPKKCKTAEVVQKATKRCEEEIRNHIPLKKSAHEGTRDVQKVIVATADDLLSPNRGFVVPQSSSPMATVSEGTLTHESQKEEFKRSLKSQKISAISLSEGDVNPHEITFNIDMAEFDQVLDDEKDSMFQMTYNESIKKAAEQEATHKPNDHGDRTHEDYEMAVQPNFKGVHKSGYHSSVSDQYAAMVTPNKPKATSTRKFSVHERIQMLLEEAAYQQNIVLQASQAVNTSLALHEGVSTGSLEEVEAERLLKFSTERRTTCLDEVQKLKTGDTKDDACMNEQPEGFPCNATLTISGIKITLDQKLLQSKNSQELCIYSFICIIKHNPKQMYCTKAVASDEIKNNCIIFDDKFEIKNVKPSFALDISVFMLKTLLPLANPVSKHKKKTAIAKSVLDSPKIKQIIGMSVKKTHDNAAQVIPGATHGPVFRMSGFALVASTQINLENVHHGKHKVNQVEGKSVLAGDLKIKIACNPEYCNQAKGFLTIFEDVGGLGDWLRYWCILDRNVLQYWKYPDEEIVKPPLGSIDLGYCVSDSVTIVPRDICARPHTMQLVLEKPVTSSDRETLIAVNTGGKMIIKYMLSADTKADKTTWLNTLNDSLKDWRAWHHNLRSKDQHGNLYSNDVIML